MFGKRKLIKELEPPPISTTNPEAMEILRMWSIPDDIQQVSLRICWKHPGTWGLALVDIARHVALAYEREGYDRDEVLRNIRTFFDAEWLSPTDTPKYLTDDK